MGKLYNTLCVVSLVAMLFLAGGAAYYMVQDWKKQSKFNETNNQYFQWIK